MFVALLAALVMLLEENHVPAAYLAVLAVAFLVFALYPARRRGA
jgi:hypothetical protein